MKIDKRLFLFVAASLVVVGSLFAIGPAFRPDHTVKGSDLADWKPVGQAKWEVRNGEITGTPQENSSGILMLNDSLQDVGFHASFLCSGSCQAGILFRLEKTSDGMKGIYLSLTDPDPGSYRVTLTTEGRIVDRERLRRAGGQMRIAPPGDANAAGRAQTGRPRPPVPANLPLRPPDTSLRPGEWNTVEIYLDANIIRAFLNDSGEIAGGAAEDDAGRYGPVALYVAGAGTVRFKDVSWTDLGVKSRIPEKTGPQFRKQRLSDFYYSWGAGAGDFNHDGVMDVVAGPYIYFGPDYTHYREVYLAHTSNPGTEYTQEAWMQYSADFTGDGWPDVVNGNYTSPDLGITLYVNPRGEKRRWDKFTVVPAYQSEIGMVRDIDGDGRPEMVYMAEGYVRYAKPDPAKPTAPWIVHNVSEQGYATAHGIGVGDINGDGRLDIVNAFGWWEQPPAASSAGTWTYHPQAFARYGRNIFGGSVMGIYDVNGDGLNDVVTVLNPHGWGLAWYEQKREAGGSITFVQHMIMDDFSTKNAGDVTFSEPHGTAVADVDGDGIPDFIVGKRYWAHRDDYLDPYPYGPPVLYAYRTVRNRKAPGGAEFVPELIDNSSGTGSDVLPVDLNHDGAIDIVTATRFGTFIFWGKPGAFKAVRK
ncbi:MAG: FG-GAP-like repeat-containing protein [Bryobacteraceae bacterium]